MIRQRWAHLSARARFNLPSQRLASALRPSEGAQVTTDALQEGAFDFILKPSGGAADENRLQLQEALDQKLPAFQTAAAERERLVPGAYRARAQLTVCSVSILIVQGGSAALCVNV